MRDIHNNLTVVQALDPALTTSERAGAPIDRQGFEVVGHSVLVGTAGDTLSGTNRIELRLEHSQDGADWSPVNQDRDVLGGPVSETGIFARIVDSEGQGTVHAVGYVGAARYSRVRVTLEGTHTRGTVLGALCTLGFPMLSSGA